MKVLPTCLHPWRSRIERRHCPRKATGRHGYRAYRQCLRWEFGFTCAFCQLHEADFVLHGAEGTGVTQIEHFVPASHDASSINDYDNLLYICRFCNMARGAAENFDRQRLSRLLEPCSQIWSEHFLLKADEVRHKDGDADAAYTEEKYDLNDVRKVKMRAYRRERLQEALRVIEEGSRLRYELEEKADRDSEPEIVDLARFVGESIANAWKDLAFFKAVPDDAECPCRCKDEPRCEVPEALKEQLVFIESTDPSTDVDDQLVN